MVEPRHTLLLAASAVGGVVLILGASSCRDHSPESGSGMTAGSTRLVVRWTPATPPQDQGFRARCLAGESFGAIKRPAGQLLRMRPSRSQVKSSCELLLPFRSGQAAGDIASARDLGASVEVWELVSDCDGDERAPIRLRNHYYPKSGRDREVLDWRLHACDVREQLGRPRGCVWKRLRGPAGAPKVMWELPVEQITEELVSAEGAAASTDEFRGVIEHMKTLLDRFEPETWDVVGQGPPREDAASPAPEVPETTGVVKHVTIDHPATWWTEKGFVELHAPIHLPTNQWRSSKITVWLMIPEGARISWGDGGLRYPPGTIADRVELVLAENAQKTKAWTVYDVRGTRIGDGNAELFHVYRPESAEVGARLKGFEWPRGHRPAQAEATALLIDYMRETPVPMLGRPLPEKGLALLRTVNQCAPCHLHGKELSPQDVSLESGLPRSPTDGHGFFHPLRVLSDINAVEAQRPYDLNVDDPLVTVRCGAEPAKVTIAQGKRYYVCPEHQTPLGERDMRRGLAENDPLTLKVCDSRRYLFERMNDEARAHYAAAFEVCGIR